MQNTMVGGGDDRWGKKEKEELGEKKLKKREEKGKKKGGKLHEKKGKKALKMHLFG